MLKSFANAFRGLILCIKSERNMRIHLCIAVFVVFYGIWARFEPWAWAVVVVCFALVIGAEMLNTAIEKLCDRLSEQEEEAIRNIKDIAAGAVLVCALCAAAAGLIVFYRG